MSFINEKMILVDTIYNPIKTKWLLDGRKIGARVVGGLDMFIAQGILSAEIWFGIDIFNRINLSKIREDIKEEIC